MVTFSVVDSRARIYFTHQHRCPLATRTDTHTVNIVRTCTHTQLHVYNTYMYMYTPGLMMTTKKCLETLEILDEKFSI